MSADDLACIELVELLTDLLDGALPPDVEAAVRAHLDGCEGCAEALAQWQATIDAIGRSASFDDLEPERRAELLATFRRRCGGGA